jgi:hypothetical protein
MRESHGSGWGEGVSCQKWVFVRFPWLVLVFSTLRFAPLVHFYLPEALDDIVQTR